MGPADSLRDRRLRLGITQAELARRVGTSQSAVAAYESGAKSPSAETLHRLDRSLAGLPGQTLADRRDAVIALLAQHRATGVRVFGSVARGEDTFDSDIDLLVDFADGASLFDVGGLMEDLEELLAPHHVDVVSTGALLPRDDHIRAEARPL
jgi:predicted nucleotidyltransferase